MKNKFLLLFLISNLFFIACNSKAKKEDAVSKNETVVENSLEKVNSSNTLGEIWQNLPLKQFPVHENTNFDNMKIENELGEKQILLLKLNEIYPKYNQLKYIYTFQAAYKIDFSKNFYSIVVNVLKGDHEVETVLVNYSFEEKLTDFKVIAFDGKAESKAKKISKIEKNFVTITDEVNLEETKVETSKFHVNISGEFNLIKDVFISTIRPNEAILLNKTYTDTIEFLYHDDDYDYKMLFGKKNQHEVSFVYDWDWNTDKKYNFNSGDILEITWKMDSLYIAGDCETLDFKERVVEAKAIKKNNSVRFLWRENRYNEDAKQEISTIIINESFLKIISNQEKAALGYVATLIGNECDWDGAVNADRSNLKCKILTALNLGYQCSDSHLGFLKQWFSKDKTILDKLEICPTMPVTATIQTTFVEIELFNNKITKIITITYKVTGVNVRESESWSYKQTDIFKYDLNNIGLINSKKTTL